MGPKYLLFQGTLLNQRKEKLATNNFLNECANGKGRSLWGHVNYLRVTGIKKIVWHFLRQSDGSANTQVSPRSYSYSTVIFQMTGNTYEHTGTNLLNYSQCQGFTTGELLISNIYIAWQKDSIKSKCLKFLLHHAKELFGTFTQVMSLRLYL